jgi:hypothetical protein
MHWRRPIASTTCRACSLRVLCFNFAAQAPWLSMCPASHTTAAPNPSATCCMACCIGPISSTLKTLLLDPERPMLQQPRQQVPRLVVGFEVSTQAGQG